MNYYRYEVTIKDLNGFPHTHYEYHHDIDACRAEREAAVKELGEMATIGPIQQSEMHIWKNLEGEYQSGTRDAEEEHLKSTPYRVGKDLQEALHQSAQDFSDYLSGLKGEPFQEESSTVMTPAELAEETKRAINRVSWSSNESDSKSEE